jgi:hypothetical protein
MGLNRGEDRAQIVWFGLQRATELTTAGGAPVVDREPQRRATAPAGAVDREFFLVGLRRFMKSLIAAASEVPHAPAPSERMVEHSLLMVPLVPGVAEHGSSCAGIPEAERRVAVPGTVIITTRAGRRVG